MINSAMAVASGLSMSLMTSIVKGLGSRSIFSLPATRVIRALNQIIEWRGAPCTIRCDNGPEYISELVATWTAKRGIGLQFIQPGKPQQNAYIERYNRRSGMTG